MIKEARITHMPSASFDQRSIQVQLFLRTKHALCYMSEYETDEIVECAS